MRKGIVLLFSLFLSVEAIYLLKRDHWSFSTGKVSVTIGWESVKDWAGMAAAVCAWCAGTGPCCVGAAIVSTLLAADIDIAIKDDTSGSEAHNTKRNVINLFDNNTEIVESWDKTFASQGLDLIAAFEPVAKFSKRDGISQFAKPHLKFTSVNGTHLAVHATDGNLNDLANLILESVPGVPLIRNDTTGLFKRDDHGVPGSDGFKVYYVTYNYDNVNRVLAGRFLEDDGNGAIDNLGGDITEALMNHRGWKYCMSLGDGGSASDSDLESGRTGTAVHGETYFNTYGGIDGQCNDVLGG